MIDEGCRRPVGGYTIDQGDTSTHELDVRGCRFLQSTADGVVYFCRDNNERVFWLSLVAGSIYDLHDLSTARWAPDPGKLGTVRLIWSGVSGTKLNIW